MNASTIYVIGHKNPDTDSICSAMAYARLRAAQGLQGVQAARAGNINRQTEFVLEELALPVPPVLTDVHPRVRDVLGEHVVTVPWDAPLSRALELFHLHSIRMLPVIDAERRPLGALFLKKISERFLVPREEKEIRRVQASPASIMKCLKAQALNLVDGDVIENLNLYVGAMDSATFHQRMEGLDPRGMILVTGDRLKILREAVDFGVRVLIVTGSLPVPTEILERGIRNQVTILSTPFDTATTSWLTRLSTPVHHLVKDDFISIGALDRLDDLRLKLLHSSDPGAVVLDGEGRVCGVATKSNLLRPSPVKLILVDHNELSQAVSGAEKVEIIEVVDHHRLGNFHTDHPIRFINQPLGSTCSVVASLYRQSGIVPDRVTAGLMLAGLLSDTVILKSPTTTDVDRELATWLGGLSGLDPQDFGKRIFSAGSALAAYPSPRHLVLADFKEYEAGEQKFGVGQVEVVSFQEFHNMKEIIVETLGRIKEERHLDMAGLLVTDIVQETSLLLALGGKELPYVISYPQVEDHIYELKGVLSRKKQLVPHLLKVLKGV
ncbi:putative manganese-dependent inorganic diphosphatase [Geoalkalibacter sp.]|uniref:putative manganese-dependent inorganic diphosphatase n=1 Tax=Geoalkalibacter sp. TaxID=3041440 RepID=UPI00272E329E|nr:putative manganese-dependent inorganic diphosphatase [Geoalkalibacter sp.]